jgi:glycosyltransferase involved in cell wall biosynthesis
MNIGIEATSAGEAQKAGVGYYTYNLIRAMALLHCEDHTYTLYLRKPWQDSGTSFVCRTESPNSPSSSLRIEFESNQKFISKVLRTPCLWAQLRLPLELWTCPQDVYFFPSSVLPLLYQPSKSVITIHDIAYLFFPDCFSPMLRRWLKIATKHGIARAKKIITVSEFTRQDLITYYGVAPEKVVAIHHGVHEMFRPFQAQMEITSIEIIKKKYQIEGPYILCIGTLQKRKNIPRLLHSFSLLKQSYNIPHKLVLIGQKCPDLPEHDIFSTVERLFLQENVVWTGYVTEQDMPVLLNGAELFVFPSLYEGFGMPVLEAMASGVPVACSNSSSLPEVVGDSGVMFDPYNIDSMTAAIHRALMNQELREKLRQQGLQRAKEFTWKRCAQKTLDVLETVCYEK